MDVILLERIERLGQMGEVVNVKPGYARNYLLPQGKALRATAENVARFENERVRLEATNLERRNEAEAVAAKLADFTCVLLRQASEGAQLYGSVTARDIAEAATESGVSITRQQVRLDRPIKTLGIHPVRVALHPEVIVGIKVNVARSAEEAEARALAAARPEAPARDEAPVTPAGGEPEAAAADEAAEAPSVEEIFEQPETVRLDEPEADEAAGDAAGGAAADEGAGEATADDGGTVESADESDGPEAPEGDRDAGASSGEKTADER